MLGTVSGNYLVTNLIEYASLAILFKFQKYIGHKFLVRSLEDILLKNFSKRNSKVLHLHASIPASIHDIIYQHPRHLFC
jgi:hypothetical protein